MTDEFEKMMQQLGVRPLRGARARKAKAEPVPIPPPPPVSAEEEALFAEAIESLDAVPLKDVPDLQVNVDPDLRVGRLRLKMRGDLRLGATLDLHHHHRESAMRRLDRFIRNAVVDGHELVLVITGKGHHSRDGEGVLRAETLGWIETTGRPFVKAYAEAPRRYGGGGALVLQLRRQG